MSRALSIALAFVAAALAGCSHYEPLALHGAGMMRVEVEVYKGPLSVPPSAQMGELVAVLTDAVRASAEWRVGAEALMGSLNCAVEGSVAEDRNPDCQALRSAVASAEDVIGAGCYVFNTPAMKDLVGLATYLPIGTCGQYASAWRHIDFRLGDFDESLSRALPKAQLESLRDALQQLAALGKAEDVARAALAKADAAHRKPAAAALQAAIAARAKELATYRATADRALRQLTDGQAQAKTLGQPTLYDVYVQAVQCALVAFASDEQKRLTGVKEDGATLWPTPMTNNLRCQHEAVVLAVQNMASVLRAAGFRSSFTTVRYVAHTHTTRASLAAFAFLAGEYGNQLQSRIAVLAKQLAYDRAPANLPVSDFLRDAYNTDAVHLFDWLDATDDRPGYAPPGKLTPADRVRMVERLTADHYWTKINDVYASGQGDVTMAFIKDDIGNWTLKSFSNEPGKLLKAYRDAANAAIVSAGKLAAKAANPAVGVADALPRTDKLLSLARQFATGRIEGGGGAASANPDTLLAGLVTRIETRRKAYQDKAKALATQKAADEGTDAAPGKVAQAQTAAATAKAEADRLFDALTPLLAACTAEPCPARDKALADYRTASDASSVAANAAKKAQDDAAATRKALEDLPAEATRAIQALIDDARTDIDALQKAALPPAPASPAAPAAAADAAKAALPVAS